MSRLKDIFERHGQDLTGYVADQNTKYRVLTQDQFEAAVREEKLKSFEEIKFSFDVYSDSSIHCLGYKWLCKRIEELKQQIPNQPTAYEIAIENIDLILTRLESDREVKRSPYYTDIVSQLKYHFNKIKNDD